MRARSGVGANGYMALAAGRDDDRLGSAREARTEG